MVNALLDLGAYQGMENLALVRWGFGVSCARIHDWMGTFPFIVRRYGQKDGRNIPWDILVCKNNRQHRYILISTGIRPLRDW
jgi:hypothetical protein